MCSVFVHMLNGVQGTCSECGLSGAIAGVESNFALQINDGFGNRIPGSIDASKVPIAAELMRLDNNLTDTSTAVIDAGDGTQLVKINPTASGLYRLTLTLAGDSVSGTPALVDVLPGNVAAASSTPDGIPTDAEAGKETILKVIARDFWGNVKDEGSVQPFKARFTGRQRLSTPLEREGKSGVYSSPVTITVAGSYSLAIVLYNANIKGSPYSMTVHAGAVSTRACFAMGSNTRFIVAGATASFPVYVRDKFLNFVKKASQLERGFTATLTSWGVPDTSRPGLYRHHAECSRKLNCPLSTIAARKEADRQNAGNEELLGAGNFATVKAKEEVKRVVVRAMGSVKNAATGSVVMEFVALMPGSYVLNVTYFGLPVAKSLGDTCQGDCNGEMCTACPVVAPAPAPLVDYAMFQDNGGQFRINFVQESDRANQRGLFNCSMLITTMQLLAAPGASPQCTFANSKTLVVLLGYGATIKVNEQIMLSSDAQQDASTGQDELRILAGGLRGKAICESPFAASGPVPLCFQITKAVKGPVRVRRPPNAVKPTAILKGPSLLGPCDDLELDASSSYGSGGRELQFELGLKPSTADDSVLRAFVSAASQPPYTQKSWRIDPSLLTLGLPATFVLRAFNFLDQSSLSELTVVKRDSTAPIIMIEGPQSKEVFSTQITRLRGDVVLSRCASEIDKSVDFEWSLVRVSPDDLSKTLELDSVTRATRSLYIAPKQLVPGHTYTFQLTGTMKTNRTNTGSEQVSIVCVYAPLVAKLAGSDRAIKWGDILTLDATASIDLDGAPPPGAPVWPLDYAWDCFTASGSACLGPENPALLVNEAKLLLDSIMLAPGVYTFRVTLLKEPGPRRDSASVKIWILPNVSPALAVVPLDVRKVNPGDRVLLQGALASTITISSSQQLAGVGAETSLTSPTAQLLWEQVEGTDIMQYPQYLSISPQFPSVAIREGVLHSGQDYRFRFTVLDTRYPGAKGVAEIAFTVNLPPSSGLCGVTPQEGYSNTDFEMLCKHWVDDVDDLPLTYEYRYMLPRSTTPSDEIPIGTLDKNVLITGLPAPPEAMQRHDVNAVFYVIDQSGGKARSHTSVQVLQGTAGAQGGAGRRLLQEQGLAKMDLCVATGNVECIIQMTIAVAETGSSGKLKCTDKSAMISRLRQAAGKLRMNKVEVAGFSTAIKEASGANCTSASAGGGSTRRTMGSSEVSGSLDLVSSLVSTSKDVGLEGLAAKGMGDSLSSALGSISTINVARRSVRRALRHLFPSPYLSPGDAQGGAKEAGQSVYPPGDAGHSPFLRRLPDEYAASAGWEGRRASVPGNQRRSSGDVMLDTLASLSASQLGGALEGEDSATIVSELISMSSQRAKPDSLEGATIAPAGGDKSPAFSLPRGILSQVRERVRLRVLCFVVVTRAATGREVESKTRTHKKDTHLS